MVQSAAIMVLDHMPDDDEIEELAFHHLEAFEPESAHATIDIVYKAPDWLDVHERDQINAHMRDGGACIIVIHLIEDEEDADTEEDF